MCSGRRLRACRCWRATGWAISLWKSPVLSHFGGPAGLVEHDRLLVEPRRQVTAGGFARVDCHPDIARAVRAAISPSGCRARSTAISRSPAQNPAVQGGPGSSRGPRRSPRLPCMSALAASRPNVPAHEQPRTSITERLPNMWRVRQLAALTATAHGYPICILDQCVLHRRPESRQRRIQQCHRRVI